MGTCKASIQVIDQPINVLVYLSIVIATIDAVEIVEGSYIMNVPAFTLLTRSANR